jgi:hypothetical protein
VKPLWRAGGRTLLLALLAGAAVVTGGRLFLHYYESEVQTFETGLRGEAAANPLLAAERLLTRLGYPARRCDGEIVLPPRDHVLLLLNRGVPAARLHQARLLAWMRQGGRLIVTPAAEGWQRQAKDPLLAEFGVEVETVDTKAPRGTADRVRVPLAPIQDHGVVRVAEFSRLVDSRAAAAYARGDALGATLLVFHYGKGELTVLNSSTFLSNRWIGRDDNAAFLLWLLVGRRGGRLPAAPAGVELSSDDEMPDLMTLAAQYGWTVLVPALLLLAALAWRAAARFGPLLSDPPEERRGLIEHLEAAGRWLWHGDHGRQRRALVDSVRRALRERLETRRPAWSKLAEPELILRLGAASGLAPQFVAEALHGPGVDDEIRFASTIRTLALLRRSL